MIPGDDQWCAAHGISLEVMTTRKCGRFLPPKTYDGEQFEIVHRNPSTVRELIQAIVLNGGLMMPHYGLDGQIFAVTYLWLDCDGNEQETRVACDGALSESEWEEFVRGLEEWSQQLQEWERGTT